MNNTKWDIKKEDLETLYDIEYWNQDFSRWVEVKTTYEARKDLTGQIALADRSHRITKLPHRVICASYWKGLNCYKDRGTQDVVYSAGTKS